MAKQRTTVFPIRKSRTITLTDRAPIKIDEAQWPQIASATERPGAVRNGTPVPDYETDCHTIRVRRHADGRAIVYAVLDASNGLDWHSGSPRRGDRARREQHRGGNSARRGGL